jgi:isoleucyl-tRNA synthetase
MKGSWMKFKANSRRRALEYEKEWVAQWKQDNTFEKSVENRSKDDAYVFYDGPPFITGVPHHGTLLSSIVKDAVPRYWTMKGKRVERVWGWDCHGLPAENFVEKQLNIVDRRQIVANSSDEAPLDKDGQPLPTISLETYITKARESMVANSESWEGVIDRIGRWVDFKGAYRTMDKDFMESVWWAFKQLYEAGKIYEGKKVLMYDIKFATPVSKAEVTMDNDAYQTVTDPSAYVKFVFEHDEAFTKVFGDYPKDVAALGWTTTPWTLPGNTALAVSPTMTYCLVEVGNDSLVIAKDRLEAVLKGDKNEPLEYRVIKEMSGTDLDGLSYKQLWNAPVKDIGPHATLAIGSFNDSSAENFEPGQPWASSWKVYAADFVSAESGTGIVHIAPAYGEDDFELAKEKLLLVVDPIDDNGYYAQPLRDWLYSLMPWRDATAPLECFEANKDIAKGLEKAGIVWKIEYIRHEYPFNPRSKQRIMYRAIPSWFFDIQNSKPLMLEQNEHINWFPPHLKHGRFQKNIEQAPDWNLSRDRFWATAMPVWKGDNGSIKVVGSYAELKELSGVELDDYHRPWVDDITFDIDGEHFTRIDKVLDGWFESGSMPFAQLHYPFENQETFEKNYPADFIVEYIGQVRAWFYYVHAVNTALADIGAFGADSQKPEKEAFKNVITTGVIAGNDGRKMSKSLGNFTDPNELMDKFSADSLRFLLLGSPLLSGEDFALQDKDVGDVARKLTMIWNMYDFFTMYAEVDGWEFNGDLNDPLESLTNPLDIWIVSRLHQLVGEVEKHMDGYNIPDALSPVLPFLDDASNWYVRRSRRRFWKSEDDGDKNDAYRTLHYVLVRLAYVLAPFTPFLAEELYHKLTGDEESIHLKNWLSAGAVNEQVMGEMETVREYVNQGLSLRAKAGMKVRQPLASVTVPGGVTSFDQASILEDELNVKAVIVATDTDAEIALDTTITPELHREGLMREVIRHVQAARKDAGLNIDDRISLSLNTENEELRKALEEYSATIIAETLAHALVSGEAFAYTTTVLVEGAELTVSLEKS